jgi:choline dehydrogenase-like flavoprotein
MGADARASVVNSFGQAHDVRNLFVCDTSVFVTSAGVNPTLTAMAIANRSADFIAAAAKRGEL